MGAGMVMSWNYGQALWQVCRAGLSHWERNLPPAWQLIVPALVLMVMVRAGLSIRRQMRATRQLTHLCRPLQTAVPARLQALLAARNLRAGDVVFLQVMAPHAFSLGFWRSRIWLTAGLVNLLTVEELAAVLDHEAYHCRQRDPLRLLISRALKSAFFFLPLMADLAGAAELQQEMAADQAAIQQAGDNLPLLCALQKLLTQAAANPFPGAAYSPFNVTEARLRRLLASPQVVERWRIRLLKWAANVSVIAFLSTNILFSVQPAASQTSPEHCPVGPAGVAPSGLLSPDTPLLYSTAHR